MGIQLNTTERPAFCLAETAIQRVLGGNTFQWEKLDIEADDFSPQQPDIEEDTHFIFCGRIVTSGKQFTVLSSVRMTKNCELVYADVLCHPSDALEIVDGRGVYTPAEDIKSYTFFENQSGDLAEVA